ncbi:MAG: hypothetical protein LLF89_05210 [Spirochaetaceae bacterium]|nr:hypothetical protein [Spirochaetaceae bacterium]
MKRIALGLAVLIVAISLTGCPSVHTQAYPDYELPIKADVSTTTNTEAIQVTATATAETYSKYTLTISGLTADIGKKFVVAGESIGSTTATIGPNWNVTAASVTDTGLVGTVDDAGTFTITFYGKAPGWGDAANGAQFKICIYDDPSWNLVLSSSGGNNFCVAGATGNDIVLNIDPNKL